MSTFLADPVMSVALWITLKASVILGVAAIVQAALGRRRTSAAMRHLVWTLAVAGVLLVPVLSFALPDWAVVVRTAATTAAAAPAMGRVHQAVDGSRPSDSVVTIAEPARVTSSAVSTSAMSVSWPAVIADVYLAGLFVMLIRLAMQRRSVRRLAREASEVQETEWTDLLVVCARTLGVGRPVRLLRSRARSMPMTFGTYAPAILIPAVAETWSHDRRRAVMLHELAHVARYDCLTQTLALAACAMYWFHPATWWVARRLRVERELACDDRVMAAGTQPRDYAGHLLEIAYAFSGQRAPALAVGMARPGQIEGRMLAALDATRNRSVPSRRMRVVGVSIAAALLVPLATGTATVVAVDADRAQALSAPPAARQQTAGAPQQLPGTWEIRPSRQEGMIHLRLVEGNSSSGFDIPIAQLEALTSSQLSGAGGPVQFRLRRDAGTFTFEGVIRQDIGAGTVSFAPEPGFPAELAKRGFARPTSLEQYQLARHDIGYAFLDELTKQGYGKPAVAELVRAGQHGVQLSYLHDMAVLGYRLGTLAPLIELWDHGVTPSYVRDLAELGHKGLSADELRRARDHGVSAEYVRGMRDEGYSPLTMEQLITARDHGVSAEFVRGLGDAGYRKLPLDQVIRTRDHGVSAEYAREMRQLGYAVPIDDLIRARDHGVTPRYAQEIKALGYDRLSFEDLVTLRDRGWSADRIRAANARAGTRLPVDMLKSGLR